MALVRKTASLRKRFLLSSAPSNLLDDLLHVVELDAMGALSAAIHQEAPRFPALADQLLEGLLVVAAATFACPPKATAIGVVAVGAAKQEL